MITEEQVRAAAHVQFDDYWGYQDSLTINGTVYPIEWVERTPNDDYTQDLIAVFKINLDGWDRLFSKTGYNLSHTGETWDGAFAEVVAKEVVKTDYVPGSTVKPLTPSEVRAALDSKEGYDFYWDDFGWDIEHGHIKSIEINGREYPIEKVEEEDGGDREWSYDVWIIFKVGDYTFKKAGFFRSHEGTDWDAPLIRVESVKKTIDVWEEVV